jgi:FixJ family two-component response regulator
LNAAGQSAPDCLILDVRMPGVSGLELQQRLIRENNCIPIVFVSAHSEAGEKEQALAAGAVDFLYKPFSEDSLLGAVGAAVKPEAIEEN